MFLGKTQPRPAALGRFITALIILAAVMVAGTFAYVEVEGWGVFDSFYQTVIVISTLGIRQVKEMGRGGEIVTLILIIGGVGAFTYVFSAMANFLVEGQLRRVLGRKKVDAKIAGLKGHYIICGYSRIGQLIAENLRRQKLPVVVVDHDPEVTAQIESDGFLYVLGDAHDEEVLRSAGIAAAQGVVSVLPTDADNVFVTLTVRGLSEKIMILAQALDPNTEGKLKKAGADRVCNPHVIGANRITSIITHPTLVEFIDGAAENVDIEVQEIVVGQGSGLVGLALKNSGLREKAGVQAIAIKRKDGKTYFSPPPNFEIRQGDILVCVGPKGSASRLEEYVNR